MGFKDYAQRHGIEYDDPFSEKKRAEKKDTELWGQIGKTRNARKVIGGVDPALKNVKEPNFAQQVADVAFNRVPSALAGAVTESELARQQGVSEWSPEGFMAGLKGFKRGITGDANYDFDQWLEAEGMKEGTAREMLGVTLDVLANPIVPGLLKGGAKIAGKVLPKAGELGKRALGTGLGGGAYESGVAYGEGDSAGESLTKGAEGAAFWGGTDLGLGLIGKGVGKVANKLGKGATRLEEDIIPERPTEWIFDEPVNSDFYVEPSGRTHVGEPQLELPGPPQRLALPEPEKRLALSAGEELTALPRPGDVPNWEFSSRPEADFTVDAGGGTIGKEGPFPLAKIEGVDYTANTGLKGKQRLFADTDQTIPRSDIGDPAYLSELTKKYNSLIKDEVTRLKDEVGGVVKYRPEEDGPLLRTSLNAKWYRDFWKANGKDPSAGDYRDMAIKNLVNGVESDLSGTIPPNDEFIQTLSELSRGQKLPEEWHGLQKSIRELEGSSDSIIEPSISDEATLLSSKFNDYAKESDAEIKNEIEYRGYNKTRETYCKDFLAQNGKDFIGTEQELNEAKSMFDKKFGTQQSSTEGVDSLITDMKAEQAKVEPFGLTRDLGRLNDVENGIRGKTRMKDMADYGQYNDAKFKYASSTAKKAVNEANSTLDVPPSATDRIVYDESAMGREDIQLADKVANALSGTSVIPVKMPSFMGKVQGFFEQSNKKIFLNKDMEDPATYVTLHEVGHRMEATHPEHYYKMLDVAVNNLKDDHKALIQRYQKRGYGVDEMPEEYFNDLMAEMLHDKTFIGKLRDNAPEVIQPLLQVLDEVIAKVKLALSKDDSVLPFIENLERLRSELAPEYQSYMETVGEQQGKSIRKGWQTPEGIAAKQGLGKGATREIIGKGNSGDVFKEGDFVYKGDKGEGDIYENLKGIDGIAQGQKEGNMVKLPYYKNVISIDTIPKDKRQSVAPVIRKNIERINNAVAEMSNRGIRYSDQMQFGVNKDGTMDLIDFSIAEKPTDKRIDVVDENYGLLNAFYRTFGLDGVAEVNRLGRQVKSWLSDSLLEDYASGDWVVHGDPAFDAAIGIAKRYGSDIKPENIYYSTNAREVQMPGIYQSEPVDGIKVILTDKPLTPGQKADWEIGTIYEQSKPSLGKGATPDIRFKLSGTPDPAENAKSLILAGASKINTGTKYGTWAKEMVAEHGQGVEKNLPYIWHGAQDLLTKGSTTLKIGGQEIPLKNELLDNGQKVRSLGVSGVDAEFTSPEVKQGLVNEMVPGGRGAYDPITNKETLEQAKQLLNEDADAVARRIFSGDEASAVDNAAGMLLVKQASDAGNHALAVDLTEAMAKKATQQGQSIQALSMWGRLTPEGMLRYAQKVVDQANKVKGKKGKVPTLKVTPETAGKIKGLMDELEGMPEGREKVVKTAQVLRIVADQVPPTILQKIATFQTMAQLLNLKTATRNVVGNAGFGVGELASDVVGTGIDKAVSKFTGERTQMLPSLKTQIKGGKQGWQEGYEDAMLGINTGPVQSNKFEITSTPTFREDTDNMIERGLAKAEKLLNIELRATDRAFFKAAYEDEMRKQAELAKMNARKFDFDTADEVARHTALRRTFQDDNVVSEGFSKFKKILNGGKDFGIGDFVIKYPKTPANLLVRGLEYSPAGFVNTVFEASKPLMGKGFNQKAFVDSFSRALVGTTGLVGMGALLHKLGIVSGKPDADWDLERFKEQVGLGSYRVNASALKRFVLSGLDPDKAKLQKNDLLINYDWFQPYAIGIALGADIDANNADVTGVAGTLINALATGINTFAEQPIMQGIQTVTSGGSKDFASGIVKTLQGVPASFVPTLLSQVRQLVDSQARSTYDPDAVNESLNKAISKVPILNERLPQSYSSLGKAKTTYQNVDAFTSNRNPWNVFISPAFQNRYKPTPESEMVLEIYNNTGETSQVPRMIGKYFNIKGKRIDLTAEEYSEMQRIVGEETQKGFEKIPDGYSDDKKIKMMGDILTAAGRAGKKYVLENRGVRYNAKNGKVNESELERKIDK